MYQPLKISPTTPPVARRLIQHLDMLLNDVHAMFRLPLKEDGLTAGCNFAAAVVLLEMIGGISVTLFQHSGGSGERYKTLLERYYPWDAESAGPARPVVHRLAASAAAYQRYKFWRNP